MAPDVEPPELARLVDYAERSRVGDWSLRSALVRYAQGQPRRVSQVLELVRRIDVALGPHAKVLQRNGPAVWGALRGSDNLTDGPEAFVAGVLRAAEVLDALADRLASWAQDRRGVEPPEEAVDAAVRDVAQRLDGLGVAREESRRPAAGSRGTSSAS